MAEIVFKKPHALTDVPFHYCPGCTHGIVHRLVAEVIDELGVEGNTTGVASVGCSVYSYNYFNCDMVQAPHGRAPAVATGIKRAQPHRDRSGTQLRFPAWNPSHYSRNRNTASEWQ